MRLTPAGLARHVCEHQHQMTAYFSWLGQQASSGQNAHAGTWGLASGEIHSCMSLPKRSVQTAAGDPLWQEKNQFPPGST